MCQREVGMDKQTMPRERLKAAKRKAANTVMWRAKEYREDALASKALDELETEFEQYQSTRDRYAVYGYLTAVYRFAFDFETSLDCKRVAKRMAERKEHLVRRNQDRFGLLILATSTTMINEKTRWKWRHCLTYAISQDVEPNKLKKFIANLGGINKCAAKWIEFANG